MTIFDCIVVGGGAAGIKAAIGAASIGERVCILESNKTLARKILISGNGRCNFTNLDADSVSHYHGPKNFVIDVIRAFPLKRTLEFFDDLGVVWKEEKRGRLFPSSDQAQSILDLLEDRLKQLDIDVFTDQRVASIRMSNKGFVVWNEKRNHWQAKRVIMACGGISVSNLGANDSGMTIAESLGHSRSTLLPGLVALSSPNSFVRRMAGVKVWAQVSATLPDGRVVSDTDDLLFTKYGLSGFSILNLSARLVPMLNKNPIVISINFFPGKSTEQINEMLKFRWARNGHRTLELSFAGILNRKVARALLDSADFNREKIVSRITKGERWSLSKILSAWDVKVTDPRTFDHAEVTIGGIRVQDIDRRNLESTIVPGLHFCGEMVDVHGDLGGYNFQWAWASGHVAGTDGKL